MAGLRRSDDRDAAISLRRMDGFDRLGFQVRDQGPEGRVAFGHRRGELVERVACQRGKREPPLAGSDLYIACVVGVFDAAIRVAAAQTLFGGPDVEGVSSLLCQYGADNRMHERLRSA